MDLILAQELAKLSLAIQDSRREFAELQAEKEQFLVERELDANKRVEEALRLAKNAIKETEQYVELIGALTQSAESVTEQIVESKKRMQEDRRALNKKTEDARKLLDAKGRELELSVALMREEKMRLNGLIDTVRIEQAKLQDEQRKTDDKRKMLAVAIKVAKQKGVWQKQLETEIG